MTNKLEDRMDWEQIADKIKATAYPNSPEGFKEWFMTKENLGYMFDPLTYGRAYHIVKMLEQNRDHFTVFAGKEREGKSTFAAKFCALISPTFAAKYIFFKQKVFMQSLLKQPEKGDSFMADEGALILFSRDSNSKGSKRMVKLCSVFGYYNLHIAICIVNYWLLDGYIRDHRVGTIFHVTKRGEFTAYTGEKTFSIISNHGLKNYKRFDGLKVPPGSSWHGYWNKGFPELNDLNEEVYLKLKHEATNDFIKDLIKDVETEEQVVDNVNAEFYDPTAFAKVMGITPRTVLEHCANGKIPSVKIGSKYYIPRTFIQNDGKTLENKPESVS